MLFAGWTSLLCHDAFFFFNYWLYNCLHQGNPATAPKRILRSQWFLNSWSCGSYCNIAIGCTTQDLANMMEPLPAAGSLLPVHESSDHTFCHTFSLYSTKCILVLYFLCVSVFLLVFFVLFSLLQICFSAPAGLVCWRGHSSHILLYSSWSSSLRL